MARTKTIQTLDLRSVARQRPARRRWLLWGGMGLAGLMVASIAVWLLWPRPTSKDSEIQMKRAVAAVGQLMILPTGETPTYGTVADKTKLKDQTFFAKAENNDEILIYQKAQLSILYRPSINKIVNVGPLVTGNTGSPYVTSRIAILDGTSNSDALDKMTSEVTQAYPNAKVVAKSKASRTYPSSIVIDVSQLNQPLAEQVADSLGIKSGFAPLGEPLPDADIVVIIGQDFH